MSMKDKVTVNCPKCGKSFEVEQWSAINGEKNPVQKAKLLDGTLFNIKCESCGKAFTLGYPVIYNDTENKVMLWLVFDDEEIKHVTDYYKSSKTEINEYNEDVDKDYRQRIVRDSFRLREKIMIFDSGLDDKIVEISKIAYAQSAGQQCGSDKIVASFFAIGENKGDYKIEMYTQGGKALVAKLTQAFYDNLADRYGEKAQSCEDSVYIIDDVWAMDFLKNFR